MLRRSVIFALVVLAAVAGVRVAGDVPDVATNTWAPGPSLTGARYGATATPLPDGGVLVAGGRGSEGLLAGAEVITASGVVGPVAGLSVARADHAAAALPDGRVLVAGGHVNVAQEDGSLLEVVTGAVEIFDSGAGVWFAAGSLAYPRAGAAAIALPDGRIAIVGGRDGAGPVLAVEIYDPATGAMGAGGSLSMPRADAAVAVTRSGHLVVAGGRVDGAAQASADVIDPVTGTVATVGLHEARAGATATALVTDTVLIAGGVSDQGVLASTEVLDPEAGFSTASATLSSPRHGHQAFSLRHNGGVLLVGGTGADGAPAPAELVLPWMHVAQPVPSSIPRTGVAGAPTAREGVHVVAGGRDAALVYPATEFFGFATVKTDKDDYAPGEFVTITGTGWQPGETVQLWLHEVDTGAPDTPLNAVADEHGNIFNDFWAPNQSHIGVRFYLTATGAAASAQTTFTDGVSSVQIESPTIDAPITVTELPATITVRFNYRTTGIPEVTGKAEIVSGDDVIAEASKSLASANASPGKTDQIAVSIDGVPNGQYLVRVTVSDASNTGGTKVLTHEQADAVIVELGDADDDPPTSDISIEPGGPNENGWYTTDVHVTVSAMDNPGGSGVEETRCVLNPVSAPSSFDDMPICSLTSGAPVTTEGVHVVYAASKDHAGNVETPIKVASFKIDKTAPTVQLVVTAGTAGSNGWYTSAVTVATQGEDSAGGSGIASCTADQLQPTETAGQLFTGECTDNAGNVGNASLTIKLDTTGPNVQVSLAGTLGDNGWYTSDVTATTTGEDSISGPVTCTPVQTSSAETTGTTAEGQCTNDAGLSTTVQSAEFKIDKTAPTVQVVVTAGTAGSNGWYTSDVTISTEGSDPISGIASCTADQQQTTETTGQVFTGTCTNNAGLQSEPASITIKLDKTPPSAVLAVTSGTLGLNGWYVSAVTVGTSGDDSISSPVTCTAPQEFTSDTTGITVNGVCTNHAGLTANAGPIDLKIDRTPPTLNPVVDPNPALLNGVASAQPNAADATSGVATASCETPDTSSVGAKSLSCSAADNAGNTTSASVDYSVVYATGGTCLGAPGHQILEPISPSQPYRVFKQKSTVPAKFRVCDANGVSIGTPGVVAGFAIVGILNGVSTTAVQDDVPSTTPDTAFRWSSSDQQWIYNINTKSLQANRTYLFRISLDDGSTIDFGIGLK